MQTKTRFLLISSLLALAVTLLALVLISPVNSQSNDSGSGGGLRVSPARWDLDIEPGQSEAIIINVRNITTSKLDVTRDVNDFTSDGNTGDPVIVFNPDENSPYSLRPYISGPEKFTLDPDEEIQLNYTIKLPDDAAPGARFGLIRFAANASGSDGEEGVNLTASLGTIVIANTPGNVVELANLEEILVIDQDGNSGTLFESAPYAVQLKISNNGNTFVQPFGNVRVTNWGGETVQEFELNSAKNDRAGVLPQSTRTFSEALENVSGYGKYKIEANISYGDGTNIIPAEITFWVLPWKIMLIALVVIVVLIIAIVRGMKVYKKKVLKSAKTEKK